MKGGQYGSTIVDDTEIMPAISGNTNQSFATSPYITFDAYSERQGIDQTNSLAGGKRRKHRSKKHRSKKHRSKKHRSKKHRSKKHRSRKYHKKKY